MRTGYKRYILTEADILSYLFRREKREWEEATTARLALWAGRKTRGRKLGRPPGLTEAQHAEYDAAYRKIRALTARARLRMTADPNHRDPAPVATTRPARAERPYCPPEWRA